MKPWLRWTLLTGLVLAMILIPFALWEQPITAFATRLLAPAAGRALLALLIVLLLASDVLLPIPSSFVSAGAVSLLGALQGGLTIALGMTAAAWLGYLLGRYGGEPLARRMAGASELERASQMMDRYGSWVVLVCRGVPVLAEASTLLAGATRSNAWTFALVTTLGNVGLSAAYALIGVLNLSGASALLTPFAFGILVPGLAMLFLRPLTARSRA
ncbi:MAG TPA: VTT domain-containing protein [Polyangiaceae bacterium]|nr:VTT domain-containing protein [Polyangiaceae bacterium]